MGVHGGFSHRDTPWLPIAPHPAGAGTPHSWRSATPRPPYGGIDYDRIPLLPRAMRAAIGLTAPLVAGRAKRLTRAGR